MNKSILKMITIFLTMSFFAFAQIPPKISYQGVLSDIDGNPVADGVYKIIFYLFNDPVSDTPLWKEKQETIIRNGIFNVMLGSNNPLNLPFDEPYWLGISVAGGDELLPRIELSSSAYSLNARSVADSSVTASNIKSGQVVRSLNSLKDDIKLSGGENVTVSQRGDSLIIDADLSAAGNTLNDAYNQGGPGAGRTIIADAGAVQVTGTDGVLFGGIMNQGNIPDIDRGPRLLWYPRKAAFRAGYMDDLSDTKWTDENIGQYSIAMGKNTLASGYAAVALGSSADATNDYAFAAGRNIHAGGFNSTALGHTSYATGDYSTAIGSWVKALGKNSTALGSFIYIYGDGSFGISDRSTETAKSFGQDNTFYARFANGYYLYTDKDASVGAYLAAGGNSWSVISDSTKKENFKPVNGESFLDKISGFKLTSWNYKGQDAKKYRHYGPMAQDFFAAFGNDGVGTIGNDTTISSADFAGVNFIAIQALEKRTRELMEKSKKVESLRHEIELLKAENLSLSQKIAALESAFKKLDLLMTKYLNENTGEAGKGKYTSLK